MQNRNLLFLFLCLIFFFSCTKENTISLDIDGQGSKLVVNGFISPQSGILVDVSTSQDQGNPGIIKGLNDAEVLLYEDDNLLGTIPYYDNPTMNVGNLKQYYINSDIQVKANKKYRVEIMHPEYDAIQAETTVPEIVVSQPELRFVNSTADGASLFDLKLRENSTGGFYYSVAIRNVRVPYKLMGTDTIWSISDTVYQVYSFPDQDELIDAGFESYSTRTDFFSKCFSNEHFNQNTITLPITIYGLQSFPDLPTVGMQNLITAEVRQVSYDFYRYFQTLSIQEDVREELFTTPINIYNNVKGGFGNFSGYNTTLSTVAIVE